jgi:O-antigen/teichoic acid export membrane protein
MKPVRDLLKHSSIYMIGQILTRMASVLMLPLYTHCLIPAEYGIIALLDLTAALLSTLIAGGMVPAISRHHFDGDDEQHFDRVWWTGLTSVTLIASTVCLPMWLFRQALSDLTLGVDVSNGAWFYTLTAITIIVAAIGQTVDAYLRVLKWSGVFVGISMGRLLLNVGLNVWFLVGLKMGVEGLLIGNLLATTANTAVLLAVFLKTRGGFCIDIPILRQMLQFSRPLIVTSLASMMLHEVDRYLLTMYQTLEQVGVYALAHKIGFAVHTLCLLPFLSIWHVSIYEIDRLPNSQQEFKRMFRWFVSGIGILFLGASLTVHPVLPWLTSDDYSQSIDLISVILLGFFVFGLSFHFEVPALLSKRTKLLLPGSIAALIVNIGANMLLIPYIGAWGAAWAGVITYAVFSLTILACCRPVKAIEYPMMTSLMKVLAFCATFVAVRFGCFPYIGGIGQIALSVVVCAAWAVVLLGNDFYGWWISRNADAEAAVEQPADDVPAELELVGTN